MSQIYISWKYRIYYHGKNNATVLFQSSYYNYEPFPNVNFQRTHTKLKQLSQYDCI